MTYDLNATSGGISLFGDKVDLLHSKPRGDLNRLAFSSRDKIPEFIRESYPALIVFMDAYYRYLESLETVTPLLDLDTVSDKYLLLFKDTIARGFGNSDYLDVRKFIYANKDFFTSKGTTDAFEFFFKAYFGESITIEIPKYMVASGGQINIEYYFYLDKVNGELVSGDTIKVITAGGTISLNVIRFVDHGEFYQVFFELPSNYFPEIGNICEVYTDDVLTFLGNIRKTPAKIVPTLAGYGWKVGQIIVIPPLVAGGTKTMAQVSRVTADSGILELIVLSFGTPSIGTKYNISSVNTAPTGGFDYQDYTVTSTGYLTYQHDELIVDNINNISDRIKIIDIQNGNPLSYFETPYPDSYNLDGYGGVETTNLSSATFVATPIASNTYASLRIVYAAYGRSYATYQSQDSLLSSAGNKLHDNFFYQAFAYSLKTTQDIKTYRGSIDLLHPAGTKFFAELQKTATLGTDVVNFAGFSGWNNTILSVTGTAHAGIIFVQKILNAITGIYDIDGISASLVTTDELLTEIIEFNVTGYEIMGVLSNTVLHGDGFGEYVTEGYPTDLFINNGFNVETGEYVTDGYPLMVTFEMNAIGGVHVVTGRSAIFIANANMQAAFGSYDQYGNTTNMLVDAGSNATPGTYIITGSDIKITRSVVAGEGAYNTTGYLADLNPGSGIVLNSGAYNVTGYAAIGDIRLIASSSSYALTGRPTTMVKGLTAAPSSYTFTGFSATVTKTNKLTLAPGVYTRTGLPAFMTINVTLVATASSYSITGSVASGSLSAGLDDEAYTTTGSVTSFDRSITATNASYTTTGSVASGSLSAGLDDGAYTTTGSVASGSLSAGLDDEAYTTTGIDATLTTP